MAGALLGLSYFGFTAGVSVHAFHLSLLNKSYYKKAYYNIIHLKSYFEQTFFKFFFKLKDFFLKVCYTEKNNSHYIQERQVKFFKLQDFFLKTCYTGKIMAITFKKGK